MRLFSPRKSFGVRCNVQAESNLSTKHVYPKQLPVFFPVSTRNIVSIVTCSLDQLAHVVDAAVQPVEDADQAGDGFLAELHAVLELQRQLLLAAVLQRDQEGLGILTERRRRQRCICTRWGVVVYKGVKNEEQESR